MNHAIRAFVPILAMFAALITGTVSAAEAPASKWRVQFQGKSSAEGELHFRLTPQTGEPILLTINIARGRGEMYMAKDLLAGLKKQLPLARFRSEIVHGKEVQLKAGHEEPVYTLELVDSTVEGPKVVLGPA